MRIVGILAISIDSGIQWELIRQFIANLWIIVGSMECQQQQRHVKEIRYLFYGELIEF